MKATHRDEPGTLSVAAIYGVGFTQNGFPGLVVECEDFASICRSDFIRLEVASENGEASGGAGEMDLPPSNPGSVM